MGVRLSVTAYITLPSGAAMIWVTDESGSLTFVKSEWEVLTGQPLADCRGLGWLDKVHPDDRAIVSSMLKEAHSLREQFSLRYRLARRGGDFCWVVSSAAPSMSPESGAFLGFLGALDVLTEAPAIGTATGRIGTMRPPSAVLDGAHPSVVEGLADQVLYARDLADRANERTILAILDLALVEIGYRLAQD